MKQFTIATSIIAQGWDSERQQAVQFKLLPAAENCGIIFRRTDLPNNPEFFLNLETLRSILPGLQTEYFDLMSFLPLFCVLRALGIDNIRIDCECGSLPRMGETAAMLLFTVQSAGLKSQNALKKSLSLLEPVMCRNLNGSWSRFIPSNKKRIAILNSPVNSAHKVACKNTMTELTKAFFISELCHVRSEIEIENDARRLASSTMTLPEQCHRLERLSLEKSYSRMLDVFSIFSMLPYSLNADYIGFNASKSENIELIMQLLDGSACKLQTDLTFSDEADRSNQNIFAV